MAIDLNALRDTVYNIAQINSTILSLVDVALTGKFQVDSVEIPVTTEKKTEIINRYSGLTTKLRELVNSLP